MHIPSGNTDQLTLVTFEEALAASETPSDDYDVKKWIYAPNFYSEYRYLLGTRGKNPLICIGINPSTAEPDHLEYPGAPGAGGHSRRSRVVCFRSYHADHPQ